MWLREQNFALPKITEFFEELHNFQHFQEDLFPRIKPWKMDSWYRILRPPLLRSKKMYRWLYFFYPHHSQAVQSRNQSSFRLHAITLDIRNGLTRFPPSQTHPKARKYLVWIAQRNIKSNLVTVVVVVEITPRPSAWHIQQLVTARAITTIPWF